MRLLKKHHLSNAQCIQTEENHVEYTTNMAPLVAMIIADINHRVSANGSQFAQQHLLSKGLKIFGPQGEQASVKEVDQLHRRECFCPVLISELTPEEREKAL